MARLGMPSMPSLRGWVDVADPRRVVLVSGAHAINEFYSVALPPILPLLVADFGMTYAEAGLLLTVFFGVYSACQLPAGFVADRVGKRNLIALSLLGLAAGVTVAAVAETYATLLVAQVIGGASGSLYHPSGMSLISDIETERTEGRAMGIHGFGGVAGVALAPVLVGGLANVVVWRQALLAAAAVGVVFGVGFLLVFSPPGKGTGPDRTTSPDRETDGGTDPDPATDPAPTSDSPDAAGPSGDAGREAVAGSFVARVRDRVLSLTRIPVTRWLVLLVLANATFTLLIRATQSFTTTYVFESSTASTASANGVFLVMLVGMGIASLSAGRLADRFDRGLLGAAASLVAGVLLALSALVPANLAVLSAWFFLIGFAIYVPMPAMNALAANYSDRSFSGGLFGVLATAGAVGGTVAPSLYGVTATRFGERAAFLVIAVVALFGAAVFLGLARSDPDA